jgi:hypothetical protein
MCRQLLTRRLARLLLPLLLLLLPLCVVCPRSTASSVTVRSTIRRLREQVEA